MAEAITQARALRIAVPIVISNATLPMPIVGVAPFMLDGIFIGATRTRAMRNALAASFAIYLAALTILVPSFGNHGLWAALMVMFLARGHARAAPPRA